MSRILQLPYDKALSQEEVEAWSALVIKEEYKGEFELKPVQAWADIVAIEQGGLFGTIGVVGGKTLITLRIAASLIHSEAAYRPLLMVPAEVFEQFANNDIPMYRKRVDLHDMAIYLLNRPHKERQKICSLKRTGLYVTSYSTLSSKSGLEMLAELEPDALIGDEAHNLRDKNTARTRRIMAYINHFNPKCFFLSGTLTNKSIKDYHHLISAALGEVSPLPITYSKTVDWANVLDAGAEPTLAELTRLAPLGHWVDIQRQRGYPLDPVDPTTQRGLRQAFQARLRSAPGVVFSGTTVDCSLFMVNHNLNPKDENYPGWKLLTRLVDKVTEEWETPNGDEIDHAIHTHRWLWELSAGFYNELYWPEEGKKVETARSKTRKYPRYETVIVDDVILDRSIEYHERYNKFAKEMRKWITYEGRPGMDTPDTVMLSMIRDQEKEVGHTLYDAWQYLREGDFIQRINRQSRTVRVCDYKVKYAVEWAKHSKNGIIWFYHKGIGKWLSELLPNALYCPSGKKYNKLISESEGKMVIASFRGHGTGKNLQFHQNQLFIEFPDTATRAEQTLGRLHRPGQKADELVAHTTRSSLFDDTQFAAHLNDALYIHQTLGEPQKLILADYTPPPQVFPANVLHERGFLDIKRLSPAEAALLADRFGSLT